MECFFIQFSEGNALGHFVVEQILHQNGFFLAGTKLHPHAPPTGPTRSNAIHAPESGSDAWE